MSHINFYEDEETYAKLNGELNSFIMSNFEQIRYKDVFLEQWDKKINYEII